MFLIVYILPCRKNIRKLNFIHTYLNINPETGMANLNIFVVSLLILGGFLVGIINTIAGSGTVITYSLFMMLGLPASMANGTVRLGVIMQTLASSVTFYKKGKLPLKKGIVLSIPILIGTALGALTAVKINIEVFEKILGVVFLFMLFVLLYKPERWLQEQIEKTTAKTKPIHFVLLFLMGIYGGFIHIGVGIFLLMTLITLMGYDLLKANALKVFIVFMYSPAAFLIFLFNGKVYLLYGLIAAIGNVIGGILASQWAIQKGGKFIRWFLAIIMFTFSIKLLFL